jgi:hypothetical protein
MSKGIHDLRMEASRDEASGTDASLKMLGVEFI